MAQNLKFVNTKIRSFSLDFLEVLWEIEDTVVDPLDFQLYVLRSESPMGPFDTVAGPFEDKYRFVDSTVNLLHRWRQLWYKIRSVQKADTSSVVESDAFTFVNNPDLIGAGYSVLSAWYGLSMQAISASYSQFVPSVRDARLAMTVQKKVKGSQGKEGAVTA